MKKQLHTLIHGVRNRHVLAFDLLALCFIPVTAVLLRLDGVAATSKYLVPIVLYTLASYVWKLGVFYPSGLYNRYWRFASVDELSTVVVANLFSLIAGIVVFFFLLRPFNILGEDFPRSIPIIDGLLTMIVVGGFRFGLRLGAEYNEEKGPVTKKNALIVGAGVAGSMILKELKMNQQLGIEPVGLLDDDPRKLGARIHGIAVIGRLNELPHLVAEKNVQEVIIAMPTTSGKRIRDVVQMCKVARVPSKIIPGIFEILGGAATVSQMRKVDIEDLLRRGVVKTDTEGVARLLRGSCVMITGAGGSIGSELCRQISMFEPAQMILVGHGENSIFSIAGELSSAMKAKMHQSGNGFTRIKTVIADVRDRERMRQVFQLHAPGIVFHAAAHKHVGLMEENIPDAVTNNVLGTQILVDLADKFGVEHFVMVSSDKAVNPSCMMGVTKRVAELVVHDAAVRTGRKYVSVRFGNVLGSRGSVVPIFKQQLANGGPLVVTHPDVKRYFMTIPESVQLVLQAATMGEGGEVFVLDMGEPIKIVDLARDLIRLSGLEEGRDIDIVFSGLQRGEKLSEDLFFDSELVERSEHEKIFVCRSRATNGARDTADARGERVLRNDVERLVVAAQNGATKNIRILLKQVVPEYQENIDIPGINILPIKREPVPAMSLVDEMTRS
jgi:FlaA1/EpsC-like NDP-sugar epimerase